MKTYKQITNMSDIKETVHGDTSERTSFSFKFSQDPALYLSRSPWEITRIHLKYTSFLAKLSMGIGVTDLGDGEGRETVPISVAY